LFSVSIIIADDVNIVETSVIPYKTNAYIEFHVRALIDLEELNLTANMPDYINSTDGAMVSDTHFYGLNYFMKNYYDKDVKDYY
jgi:hypothetical protein